MKQEYKDHVSKQDFIDLQDQLLRTQNSEQAAVAKNQELNDQMNTFISMYESIQNQNKELVDLNQRLTTGEKY